MPTVALKQYTSKNYAAKAEANGAVLSFSATGCAYDNAVSESFFATIKRELITTKTWQTIAELRRAVFDYIEGWYNPYRLVDSRVRPRAGETGTYPLRSRMW